MPKAYDIFVRLAHAHKDAYGMERIKPAASLIDSLGNKICRITNVTLEWVVILGKRHCSGIKPDIHDFFDPRHLPAAGTGKFDLINVRAMKIKLVFGVMRDNRHIESADLCIRN